ACAGRTRAVGCRPPLPQLRGQAGWPTRDLGLGSPRAVERGEGDVGRRQRLPLEPRAQACAAARTRGDVAARDAADDRTFENRSTAAISSATSAAPLRTQ